MAFVYMELLTAPLVPSKDVTSETVGENSIHIQGLN